MPIATRCPACGKDYQLADELAGLRVRCQACQGDFDVPRRPELLEAVAPQPAPRPAAPTLPVESQPLAPALTQRGPSNRTLLYVAIGLTGCLVLVGLVCAGALWTLTWQVRRGVDQVAKEIDRPAQVVTAPAPREKPREELKLDRIDLNKIELEIAPPIKDLDQALNKLRSGNRLEKLRALEFIQKQQPPFDRVKKKRVIDALAAAEKDEDVLVAGFALQVRAVWELD